MEWNALCLIKKIAGGKDAFEQRIKGPIPAPLQSPHILHAYLHEEALRLYSLWWSCVCQ